ncbi:hypothetical protein AQ490_15310 [Wenjunlia vitaminophila]|uniref:DAGKc domain-containing protein n=1 Tax=Wenjunlia vitaminophila TaxID=76728 RepID=A0A0T6LWL1_WENVI|nr:diacylglycerol kinase family protein [Wenjunlia vitaminophila]KRV50452.1 hypothetical protein AQ490_15310 [Wenjunlia vitaminophila]
MAQPPSDSPTCLLAVNPSAGSVTPELVRQVTARCREHGARVRPWATTSAGTVSRDLLATLLQAPDPWPDLVIAVGGDGTVRDVAEALVRLDALPARDRPSPSLVVVPAGTGNSCHRGLWADRPWPGTLNEVLSGRAVVRHIDLARLAGHDRVVLIGASCGLIADVTALAADLRHIPGRERYVAALAKVPAGGYVARPGRVLVDGRPVFAGPVLMAVVGGVRHRAGTFPVLPESVLDDGLLDVCVVDGGLDPAEREELAARIRIGTHLGRPGVVHARGRVVTMERTDGAPLAFEHDGEVWAHRCSSVTLETLPRTLRVLVPPEPVAG